MIPDQHGQPRGEFAGAESGESERIHEPEETSEAGRGSGTTRDREAERVCKDAEHDAKWDGMESGIRRALRWRLPPNWSYKDWRDEVRAAAAAAAWLAKRDFDPARGVPLEVFVRCRVVARVYSRYRQEWVYGGRNGELKPESASEGIREQADCLSCDADRLREALQCLSESERELLVLLYWEGRTQSEAAGKLRISQQAVSKRARACLCKLAEMLKLVEGMGSLDS